MLASIKIQPNIPCEYICQAIQKALTKYQQTNDISDSLLIIDIQKINDDLGLIPKIEFKDSPS
jgi:hypothetical protein